MGTRKERLLQKLNPALLKMTPKLSDDTGSFIDLDSKDSLEDGAKRLMMRFFRNQDLCEKNKRNPAENESQVTVTSAKYNENEEICEIVTERLNLPLERSDDSDLFERPGRRLQKLKTELQEKMSAKWEEEYKKRVSESEALAGKNKKVHGQSDNHKCDTQDEDDIDGQVDEGEISDAGDEADAESEGEEDESDKVPVCDDEEDVESRDSKSNGQGTPEKDCEYDDSEACSLVPAYQPGGGLLYGGSELTQAEEELPQNLLSPSLRLNVNESPGSKVQSEVVAFSDGTPKKSKSILNDDGDNSFTVKSKLFSQNPNNSFDLNDAFEFCSGQFPDGDQSGLEEDSGAECEGGDEEGSGEEGEFEEEEDGEGKNVLSESETEKEMPKTRKTFQNILNVEDSEEEEEANEREWAEAEEGPAGAGELLSEDEEEGGRGGERKKKKRTRLCYSDEEDSRSGWKEEAEGEASEEEADERSVQYDSEENEIVNPKEFLEGEAELSGSECSGDEDERGLDELEAEEGDAENLDSNAVRSQLEKIHIRYMIDDDVRNVRLLQEVLLEDGDLHSEGKGRERKLRWANIGAFETTGEEGRAEAGGGSSSEDDGAEDEEQLKLRYEKELFLMKMKKNEDNSSDEELLKDVQMVKFIRVKESGHEDRGGKSKAVADVTGALNYSLGASARGSFLARNEEFLSRLARATSCVSENVTGPKHSRNFVFASRSPERVSSEGKGGCKRQMGDSGSCGRQEKRTKVSPPDAATEPSILDLLV